MFRCCLGFIHYSRDFFIWDRKDFSPHSLHQLVKYSPNTDITLICIMYNIYVYVFIFFDLKKKCDLMKLPSQVYREVWRKVCTEVWTEVWTEVCWEVSSSPKAATQRGVSRSKVRPQVWHDPHITINSVDRHHWGFIKKVKYHFICRPNVRCKVVKY